MNKRSVAIALIVLLAVQFACIWPPTTPEPSDGGNSVLPIGKVNKIKGSVEAGPESALEEVDPERDMNNNDAIHIKDNGKASLDFGHGLAFTLYNNTASDGTSVDTSGTALQVTTRLSAGGLKGYNPPGSKTEVLLPNEAKIVILGTNYFITYNPTIEEAWVYNLDGEVEYSIAGGGLQELPERAMVHFNETRVIKIYEGLQFSTDDFDRYATEFNSPIQGVEELLKGAVPVTGALTSTMTPTLTPTSTTTFTATPSPTKTLIPTWTPTWTITPTSTETPERVTEIYNKYLSLGASGGFLGAPVGPEQNMPDGAGRFREFQGGSIYWSPSTGAYEVHGEIHRQWLALGGASFLGYPVTDELITPDGIGRFNHFQGGSIYWSPETGAHEIYGEIREKWKSFGWETSFLGYPTTGEIGTPDGIGRFNHFQGGSIYWTPNTGAHVIYGAIRDYWFSIGAEKSQCGYPTSDEEPNADPQGVYTRIHYFQVGWILWSPSKGIQNVCIQGPS